MMVAAFLEECRGSRVDLEIRIIKIFFKEGVRPTKLTCLRIVTVRMGFAFVVFELS